MARIQSKCLITDESFSDEDDVVAVAFIGGGYNRVGFVKQDALSDLMEENDDLRNLVLSDD